MSALYQTKRGSPSLSLVVETIEVGMNVYNREMAGTDKET